MLNLPVEVAALLALFAPVFTPSVWAHAQLLVVGAILTPGKRTVTAILSIMGLRPSRHFQNYHRVLNRARWSSRTLSQILLQVVLAAFGPQGPGVLGLDDTLERRRGEKIKAKGIYRDPVRSSHRHVGKASGLRWLSVRGLVTMPWAGAVWALPVLTVLAPSERYHQERRRQHKRLTEWAGQMLKQVRRGLPQRELLVVADSSFAVLTLLPELRHLRRPVSMITRLRLEAALYEPAPPRAEGPTGRPRLQGKRLPTLLAILHDPTTWGPPLTVSGWYRQRHREVEVVSAPAVWYHSGMPPVPLRWVLIRAPLGKFPPQALLSTEVSLPPIQLVPCFVQRWQVEVTFQEVRTPLGVETQRQGADLAIARTTPALFGLFTVVTLLAHRFSARREVPTRAAAWYIKELPTFADALALVRSRLWQHAHFSLSQKNYDLLQIPRPLFDCLTETLCYAA